MARAGILYSHVTRAATQLATAGKNPTVDSVREAMGGTGSKSTIAPMLKQWKAEHVGVMAATGVGLPADLLEAVKSVYQRLQEAARAQVDQLHAEHQAAEQGAKRAQDALRGELQHLAIERDALERELAGVKASLVRDQAARQKDAVVIAALEAERDGQAQRLADRAAEVRELAEQLAQARRQFEHFQEMTAEQRQTDRQDWEARTGAVERDLGAARGILQESREALAVVRAEKESLKERLDSATAARDESIAMNSVLVEQLTVSREDASAQQMQSELTAARLREAWEETAQVRASASALEVEIGRLRERLEARLTAAGKKK